MRRGVAAVGAVYLLSAGPAAYGASKVEAGERDWGCLGALVAGLTIAAGCVMLAATYCRRRKARRLADVSPRQVSRES